MSYNAELVAVYYRMLVERTQELEEQLSRSRARSGAVIDLEAQIARLKQTLLDSTQVSIPALCMPRAQDALLQITDMY